ncbi:MAG: hypothetical protein H7Y11_15265 [Armatimonadetes bacterium]|nr:hypothetical protein [Anaerolineae bacterium]
MASETLAVFGFITLMLVIVALTLLWVRNLAHHREQGLRQRFPNARAIVSGANFFGQHSKGNLQILGTGALVITEHDLLFEQWLPRREHSIPLNQIKAIETPRSELGKTNFTPLLKVVYRTANGAQDAMTWNVRDLEAVKALLLESVG